MKVIISPSKTMRNASIEQQLDIPHFIEDTKFLVELLKQIETTDIMAMMKVNANIAKLTQQRFQDFKFDHKGIPAIFAYDGIQFRSMGLDTSKALDYEYLHKTVRIISALYGVLSPLDSIYEYRLDMNTSLKYLNLGSAYAFWGDRIYNHILSNNPKEIVINLASDEYSKVLSKYIDKSNFITCRFQQLDKAGNLRTNSTNSKKLRGAMVKYIVENMIKSPETIRDFTGYGHSFNESLSTLDEWIFTT